MKTWTFILLIATLSACAARGPQSDFRATAVGPVSQGVDCVTRQTTEAGWTIDTASLAGIVHARRGADRLEATILATEELSPAHLIQIEARTIPAQELARQIVVACGT
jgi:sirohydrochlorin ferrochelatase